MLTSELQPNSVTFNSVVDAAARGRRMDAATMWLRRMEVEHGIQPDRLTFTSILTAHSAAADVDRALTWFDHMEDRNVQADKIAYNSLMNAFAKYAIPSLAVQMLDRMQRKAVESDVVTYTNVIGAFARSDDVDGAAHWLMQMHGKSIKGDSIAYGVVMTACGRVVPKRADLVEELVQQMHVNGISCEPKQLDALHAVLGVRRVQALREQQKLQVAHRARAQVATKNVNYGARRVQDMLEHRKRDAA
eukprot:6484866-Amphidinium_carterae.2